MSEKWEFVVKGGKHKTNAQVSNKEMKLIKENNLNGNRFRRGLEEETDESMSPEITTVKKNKNKVKPPTKNENDNLNQQINKINGEAIKVLHKELLEKFPNQHTVILMDLAVHLNLMLKINDDIMKNISFENLDFPYALLSNETKSSLRSVFNGLNNNNLGSFLKSAIVQIIEDNDKGIKSIGLMMLLQVCLKMKPTALIANRKSIFDLLNSYREQTVKFRCIVWAIKQACTSFNIASQMWLVYLLPFISQRCHTENVLLFGEEMTSLPRDGGDSDGALLVTDFMPLVDLVFNQNKETETAPKKGKKKTMSLQLSEAHLQRLAAVYRKVKEQIFTSKAAGNLKDFFASFFLRLSSKSKNEDLNTELLDCLDHCLVAHPDSVKQLDHLYQGYPQQTKIFLEHVGSHKSAAAAIVTKQRSYKAVAEKAANRPADQAMSASVRKSARRRDSGPSCLWRLLRALFLLALATVAGGLVLRRANPQKYAEVAARVWEVAGPTTVAVVAKGEAWWRYAVAKGEEVAPQTLEAVAGAYVTAVAWCKEAMRYAGTLEIREHAGALLSLAHSAIGRLRAAAGF